MYGEVVDPDNQDGQIDREDPEHENKDRVGVVEEVERGGGMSIEIMAERARTSRELDYAGDNVSERVRDDGSDEEEEDDGID